MRKRTTTVAPENINKHRAKDSKSRQDQEMLPLSNTEKGNAGLSLSKPGLVEKQANIVNIGDLTFPTMPFSTTHQNPDCKILQLLHAFL